MTIEFTYEWADPNLWRLIHNGGDPTVSDFVSCIDFIGFELSVESSSDIGGGVVFL